MADRDRPTSTIHRTNGDEEHRRVRVERTRALPDIEQTEIVQGAKPGSRFARRVREGERRFERGEDEATFRATERATAPRTGAQRFWRSLRKVAVGSADLVGGGGGAAAAEGQGAGRVLVGRAVVERRTRRTRSCSCWWRRARAR